MERAEVSEHELKVYAFTLKAAGWVTNHEIAKGAGVARRTARQHSLRLVQLGVFDQADVFPAHRYRVGKQARSRNRAYVLRLEQAAEVFGIVL